jgi:hypothetical protein
MTLGGFLAVSRNQRVEQRALDRIEHYWFAESIFEMATAVLNDYVKTNIKHPDYLSADYTLCRGEIGATECDSEGSHHDFLKTAFKEIHPIKEVSDLTTDSPGTTQPPENQLMSFDLKLTDWPGKSLSTPIEPQATDAWRQYTATIKLKNRHSLAQVKLSHSFKVATYSIYDYGVFYNQDLEMAFGPNATVQGPIFSNRDIYLMTDAGQTLTLEQTDSKKRILESAGNTYFYFKRAWGYNYMRDSNFNSSTVPDLVPDSFVDHDFYYPVHSDLGDSYRKTINAVKNSPGYEGKKIWYQDEVERLSVGPGGYSGFPFYYYYTNGALRNNFACPSADLNCNNSAKHPKFSFKEKGGGEHIVSLPEESMIRPFTNYPFPDLTQPTTIWTEYSNRADSALQVNLSTNYNFASDRKWDTDAAKHSPPITADDRWAKYSKNDLNDLVRDDPNLKKDLPLPDSLKDFPRLLIEPFRTRSDIQAKYSGISNDDADKVLKRLLINQADIIIDCSGADCSSETPNTSGSPEGITTRDLSFSVDDVFIDKRLTGSASGTVKAAVLDLGSFGYEANLTDIPDPTESEPDRTRSVRPDDGLVIYVKTCSVDPVTHKGCDGSVRVVKITNASKALVSGDIIFTDGTTSPQKKGYTIASNGRLWVEGDFNTRGGDGALYADSNSDGKPDDPSGIVSASIFSDSFGALFSGSSQFMQINAAVVTGTLNSSLQQKDCSQTEISPVAHNFELVKNTASGREGCVQRHKDVYMYWDLRPEDYSQADDLTIHVENPSTLNQNPRIESPPDGKWPLIAHFDPDISAMMQNAGYNKFFPPGGIFFPSDSDNADKLVPALSLAGLHTMVLVGNYWYDLARVYGICPNYYKYNYKQDLIGGEASGAVPERTSTLWCWKGNVASDDPQYYNNPGRYGAPSRERGSSLLCW